MKGVLGWVVSAVAFAVAFFVVKGFVRQESAPTPAELDAVLDKAFTLAEAQAVPTFPKKLNKYTTQTGMSHAGRVVTYTYQLIFAKADLQAEPTYFKKMKAATAPQACADTDVRLNLNDDVIMRYVYKDPRGDDLGEYEITKRDC
jgi:hypothetical protein